jgi:Arm DNA-binding domain
VTLAQARELAREARLKIKQGISPIEERKELRKELIAKQAKDVTFKECAERYIEAHSPTWKNKKHVTQWSATFETYAYPVIGKLWVREVTVEHVMQIREPIWITKTPTASRLRGRIESVLSYAKTRKYRTGENPAAWKDNLKSQLAAPKKVRKVKHHMAIPLA